MAFAGYQIFPGLKTVGVVDASVRELAVAFNTEALAAMQAPMEEDLAWTEICGVTPAIFEGKVPVDFTNLDGFEPFEGTRTYRKVDVIAMQAHVNQWQRNLQYDARLDQAENVTLKDIYGAATQAQALVAHARVMKARIAASVLMQGTPAMGKALVYAGNPIPGAGLPLFSSSNTTGAHLANPTDSNSRQFDNYYPAAGAFSAKTYADTRQNMRAVPAPNMSAETLGLQVTDIIGPSFMEEPFRQVALSQLILVQGTGAAAGAVAAPTNIYSQGTTPCKFWIAPQLDADPFVQANAGKHLWFAVSRKRVGARPIEMVAPTKEFTPRITIFGDGSELAIQTRKIHINADLDAGAAAGLPHVIARYEQV